MCKHPHITLGIDAGDSIQLAVKIAYPKEEIVKKTRVRILIF